MKILVISFACIMFSSLFVNSCNTSHKPIYDSSTDSAKTKAEIDASLAEVNHQSVLASILSDEYARASAEAATISRH